MIVQRSQVKVANAVLQSENTTIATFLSKVQHNVRYSHKNRVAIVAFLPKLGNIHKQASQLKTMFDIYVQDDEDTLKITILSCQRCVCSA